MVSVIDPEATFSLPLRQVVNGLADAFVHVLEQYTCHFNQGLIQDEQAEGVMRVLVAVAPKVMNCEKPDYQARADFCWATTQALNGLIGVGVSQCWATHGIGHMVTAQSGVDHGTTLAIIIPQLLRRLKENRKDQLARMADKVFGVRNCVDMAEEGINQLNHFFNVVLGISPKLSAYGVTRDKLPLIAKAATAAGPLGPEDLLDEKEVLAILEAVF